MCDAFSFMSAGSSIIGGFAQNGMAKAEATFALAEGIDRRSQLDFEAAQLDAMSVLASASGSRNETNMRKSYAEQSRQNLAAAAISGFDMSSFAAIEGGNTADLQGNLADAQGEIDREKFSLEAEAGEARRGGKSAMTGAMFAARMARFKGTMAALSGISQGIETLGNANADFKKYNTGETRAQSFFKSIGGRY